MKYGKRNWFLKWKPFRVGYTRKQAAYTIETLACYEEHRFFYMDGFRFAYRRGLVPLHSYSFLEYYG